MAQAAAQALTALRDGFGQLTNKQKLMLGGGFAAVLALLAVMWL